MLVADILAYDDVCRAKIGDIGGQDGSKVIKYALGLGFDIQNDKHVLLVAKQRDERAKAFEANSGMCFAVRESFHEIALNTED